MTTTLRIIIAQLNLMVGDINGNLQKLIQAALTARDEMNADIIVFPELSLTGYPPEDLLLHDDFIQAEQTALQTFIESVQGIHCLISHTTPSEHGRYNACSMIYNGRVIGTYNKQHLPNYGVFDEKRYFTIGNQPCVVSVKGIPIGLVICEDLWVHRPAEEAAALGAKILISPNASPFEIDKHHRRSLILRKRAQQNKLAIIYANNVGGQDDLIFDGGSLVIDAAGNICDCAGFFEEKLHPINITCQNDSIEITPKSFKLPTLEEKIYRALVLSLRDYVEKNHFPSVILGLSGGIDSALTLAIAVDALGANRVHALIMPSRYTADMSIEDAETMAKALHIQYDIISIEPTYKMFLETLTPIFTEKKPDITEENLQARCRGMLLMALSNKFGHLVLTTGNRSELATGYCTLYGDMAGGFDVLKDIYKTMVYRLCNYRNEIQQIIPQRIIDRPPSAELNENQKDQDSLPPYDILDAILALHMNERLSAEEIIARGFEAATVKRVIRLVRINEYKRRQAPLGPRIQLTAFGKDRRYPVTNGFKSEQ